jgi:hypothetical protein
MDPARRGRNPIGVGVGIGIGNESTLDVPPGRQEDRGCDPCASVFIRGGNQKDMNHG